MHAAEELTRKRESEEVLLKVESGLQEMAPSVSEPQQDQPLDDMIGQLEKADNPAWFEWLNTTRDQLTVLTQSKDPEVSFRNNICHLVLLDSSTV